MFRHFVIWLFLGVVVTIVSPALVTRESIITRTTSDWEKQFTLLGPAVSGYAVRVAEGAYRTLVAPVERACMRLAIVDRVNPEEVGPVLKLGEWYYFMINHILTLFISLHAVILRLTILVAWIVVLLPLFIACVIEGRAQHRIKIEEFGVHSPVKSNAAWHVLIALILGVATFLASNLPVPWVFYPAWAVVCAFCLIPFFAHMQRLS